MNFCNLLNSLFYHTLIPLSNNNALSTHASTILAYHLLLNLDPLSLALTFHHNPPALFLLLLTSSFLPIQLPSILIFPPSFVPKMNLLLLVLIILLLPSTLDFLHPLYSSA